MKPILLILTLSLFACSKDEPIKPYTFTAQVESGLLHINYQSDQVGFKIWVSPDQEHTGHDTQVFHSETLTGCSGQTTSLFWAVTYVTLETDKYFEQIEVR